MVVAAYVALGVLIGLLVAAGVVWAIARKLGVDPDTRAWVNSYKVRMDRLVDKMEREVDEGLDGPDEAWRR